METRRLPELGGHVICGLSELAAAPFAAVDRVISIISPGAPVPDEVVASGKPYLAFRFDDTIRVGDGEPPGEHHVRTLLYFAAAGPPDERLLVHCTAGISRSSAALAVVLASRFPDIDDEIFAEIRAIRSRAWPNSRIVEFGDALLGRGGRLTAALKRHYEVQVRHPELGGMFRMFAREAEIPKTWDDVEDV